MASDRFDQAASGWDQEERRVRLAHAVAEAIAAAVPLSPATAVLDFGCGTGLVSLALAARVGSLTCADTSTGMLETLAAKAAAAGTPVRTLALAEDGALGGPYDLILSSMTLHHLADVPGQFQRFASSLAAGGHVALADLDLEDGSFHEDSAGVFHRGFDRGQIAAWLGLAGFREIRVETAAVTRKGSTDFPVFLATGRLCGPLCQFQFVPVAETHQSGTPGNSGAPRARRGPYEAAGVLRV